MNATFKKAFITVVAFHVVAIADNAASLQISQDIHSEAISTVINSDQQTGAWIMQRR